MAGHHDMAYQIVLTSRLPRPGIPPRILRPRIPWPCGSLALRMWVAKPGSPATSESPPRAGSQKAAAPLWHPLVSVTVISAATCFSSGAGWPRHPYFCSSAAGGAEWLRWARAGAGRRFRRTGASRGRRSAPQLGGTSSPRGGAVWRRERNPQGGGDQR